MIDLPSLTLPKQRIQLRMCLTLETQRVLEHTLQVSPTSLKPVDEVLDILQAHIRDSNNEALRRRAFTSCRQARGEPFSEFLVRLKSLAEEFDICKAHHLDCEEAWMKHGILTGVHDEELVTKIVSLDAASTLADVINVCRAHEATRSAASAIRASPTVSAVSTYKQTKKAAHKPGILPHQPSPTHRAPTSCSSCGRRDHGPKGCPATGVTCRGCGKTGHYALMPKCPARQSTCIACNRLGHLEKVCKQTKARRSHEGPPEASCQSPISTRDDPTPPPTVRVEVLHDGHSGGLDFIPDTGADTTVIGPQHLKMLGIDRQALGPPPSLAYYNADGTKMSAALGSLQATLVYAELSCTGWIDVQGSWNTPLLSREHCRALGIVPHDFPAQILSARGSVASVREATNAPAPRSSVPALPLLSTTSPDAAKEYFLREYQDVLLTKDSTQDAPLKPMSGPPMRIHLRDDAQPFAVHTPRLISLAYRDAVKAELDSMVARGVIAPVGDVPSYWCHPMVVVPKPGGGVRITTDLSKLNAQVSRPAHPSPTPFAAIRSVDARARYFTTIDALCGYWQIPLHEDDQALTTFITPYGRFKYLRGPMGFAATGDAFRLRGDIALQECHSVSKSCRAYDITLNAKKFVLAAPSVSFCGYRLSHDVIAADPDKVRAITEFATPATLTDLRSFMGLVNQLASFSPDLAATAAPLRPLLSPKKSFVWTPDHEQAFQRVKMALASPPVLAAFDPLSRRLCRPMLPACMGWVMPYCRTTVVDSSVSESTSTTPQGEDRPYIFTAVWRPGKELCIPDALSRSPVGYPTQADEVLGTDTGFQVKSIVTLRAMESLAPLVPPDVAEAPPGSDLALEELRKVATEDPEYVQLLHFVKNGFPMDRYAPPQRAPPVLEVTGGPLL
ncbi:uncharacterized protein LOC123500536 [Portunus trituberculatus]|uniref:uncharacterized protein LOC123500536 n=1 Tax=Portunus trituberculatus TaxID=210409 RepID=UPI001E1CE6FE|nr:uncharacterized protein LOC123500536 [Portunus trituberculatus]